MSWCTSSYMQIHKYIYIYTCYRKTRNRWLWVKWWGVKRACQFEHKEILLLVVPRNVNACVCVFFFTCTHYILTREKNKVAKKYKLQRMRKLMITTMNKELIFSFVRLGFFITYLLFLFFVSNEKSLFGLWTLLVVLTLLNINYIRQIFFI